MIGYCVLVVIVIGTCVFVHADEMTNIVIDGKFDDWSTVRTIHDPFQPIGDATVKFQGLPVRPDVHSTATGLDPCFTQIAVNNSHADLVEGAVAHDATMLYVRVKTVGSVGTTAPRGRFHVILHLNLDNDENTGFYSGNGGYAPTMVGIDANMELEFYNGSLNSGAVLLHSFNNTEGEKERVEAEQKQGIVTFADGYVLYKGYTEWAYWPANSPPSEDEAERCKTGNLTKGPFELPDKAHICFIADKCNGPYMGAFQVAISADGTEIEFGAPFAAFLKHADGTPVLSLGQTVYAQLVVETSGELSDPVGTWATDASLPFAYYLAPQTFSLSTLISATAVTFGFGTMIAAIASYFIFRRRQNYQQI